MNTELRTGILLICAALSLIGWCGILFPIIHIPKGVNVFAILMISLNIGAAFWGLYHDGVNQLIYGLAAAVLNTCVYINFDKIIAMIKGTP